MAGDKKHKVTVIVSAYNSEKFIEGCLDSLLNQYLRECDQLEIIIVKSYEEKVEVQVLVKQAQHLKEVMAEMYQLRIPPEVQGSKPCRSTDQVVRLKRS